MNNIKNINILDAYAKRLTNKQVNSLYEHKLKKKYTQSLNESDGFIDEKKYFTVMTQNIDFKENNVSLSELIHTINENLNDIQCHYGAADVTFYTRNAISYRKLLGIIKDFGLGECVKSRIKEKYVQYVTD